MMTRAEKARQLRIDMITAEIDRQIQLYEMGDVRRHDAGRNDHD